eukprot:scaffold3850_cov101-Skeletonema_dohrnii-CCMP3373.AAC.1
MGDGCGFRAEYEDERHHIRACVLYVSWKYLPVVARAAAFGVRNWWMYNHTRCCPPSLFHVDIMPIHTAAIDHT